MLLSHSEGYKTIELYHLLLGSQRDALRHIQVKAVECRFHIIEEEVRFFEEAKVVKKHTVLPPRPVRREKEDSGVALLEEK